MSPPGDRREPPVDTKCPPAAQRKQAKRACIYIYIYIYTVEPVYNGHPRDWTKLAVIHRWPLYTGVVLILKRYQRSEMNIKFLEIYYLK